MKKKACAAILMSIAMVISLLGSGLGYFSAKAAPNAVCSISSVTGYAGDVVTINVSVNSNPGVVMFDFKFGYDAEALEFVSVSDGNLFGGDVWAEPNAAKNPLLIGGGDALTMKNSTNTGVLFTATFKIKEGATIGNKPFTLTGAFYDAELNDVNFDLSSNGGVTVLCRHADTVWEITKEASCTETGKKQKECSDCGEVIATEVIPALGHTCEEWEIVKEATETENGLKKAVCIVCGEEVTEEVEKLEPVQKPSEETEPSEETSTESGTGNASDTQQQESFLSESQSGTVNTGDTMSVISYLVIMSVMAATGIYIWRRKRT